MTVSDFHYIMKSCSCFELKCFNCDALWTFNLADKESVNLLHDLVYCPKCGCSGRILNKIT